MIESLVIENFRCFKKTEIKPLKRINVIVGRNSSGKTALLESLFVLGGNPETLLRIRAQRMGTTATVTKNKAGFESLWHHLFFDFDEDETILITSKGSGDSNRGVRISYKSPLSTKLSLQDAGAKINPLGFSVKSGKGLQEWNPHEIRLDKEGEIEIHPAFPDTSVLSYYPSNIKHSPDETAQRFSSLSKKGDLVRLVDTVQKIYPFIENLSLEIDAGSPMVFAQVKDLKEKVPIQILSEGTYRMLAILVGIANTEKGVVLIDEIENGLYYDTYSEIWSTLYTFAENYRTQLFVTTHSKECLGALQSVVTGREDDFTLLRVERESGTEGSVKHFSGENLVHALQFGIDPR